MPRAHAPRGDVLAIVAARNEAARVAATVAGLRRAFPDVAIWVADDRSSDATAALARQAGARVVSVPRGGVPRGGVPRGSDPRGWVPRGGGPRRGVRRADGARGRVPRGGDKGRAMTAAAAAALASVDPAGADPIVVLCDGDLGACARELGPLAGAVARGEADLAVAAFPPRAGGGFGLALAFARWTVRRRCAGLRLRAPISGQRALRASVLCELLPFAPGYGMELAMTLQAVRRGRRVAEIELPLSHRPTRRTPAGFAHRARQLVAFARVSRREARRRIA